MTYSLTIYPTLPLVEKTLLPWRMRIGIDFDGYKNHVYRMLHFCTSALTACGGGGNTALEDAANKARRKNLLELTASKVVDLIR